MEMHQMSEFDPALKDTLWTGKLDTGSGNQTAILKSIALGQPKTFYFELKSKDALASPSLLKRLFIATRPFSLTATLTPGLVVLASGTWIEGWKPNYLAFVLSLFSVVLLQASVNLINDVYDHLKGVDFPGDIGGSGMIQKGWLSAETVFRFAVVLCVISIGLGVFPILIAWKTVWWIAVLGLIGGLGYSGLGLGLKYRALGDLVVFILCGPALTVGFSAVTFGYSSALVLYSGMVFGLASVGILHANNLNDLEVDQLRGARTVANHIGFKWSQKYFSWIYAILFAAGLLMAFVKSVPIWYALAPFLAGPSVLKLIKQVNKASGPLSPSIASIRFESAQNHLLLGGSLLFSIAASQVIKIFELNQ